MKEVLAAVERLVADERLGARTTVVSEPGRGRSAVIDEQGELLAGELPDPAQDLLSDIRQLMVREQSATLAYGPLEVYVETIAPPPRLIIFGAVHIGQELAALAHRLGYRVTVSDARPAFLSKDRFPEAEELALGWPDQVEVDFDARTFVVVLSHDARFEDPLWPRLLPTEVAYIGAMGSRKTAERRREKLVAAGFTEEQLDRIHGPIGIDIGAVTPGEVAVAILAEMTQARYHRQQPLHLIGAVRQLGRDG
ncbi:MAG TPA: XdhC family protein [Acidimicrobiia bacterium]|nr:XdhC family protein [Acidimicrobiia bacterium]